MGDLDDRRVPEPADEVECDEDGVVAIETERGVLLVEPGEPDAWIHAEFEVDRDER